MGYPIPPLAGWYPEKAGFWRFPVSPSLGKRETEDISVFDANSFCFIEIDGIAVIFTILTPSRCRIHADPC
jgi:hypothetical protein